MPSGYTYLDTPMAMATRALAERADAAQKLADMDTQLSASYAEAHYAPIQQLNSPSGWSALLPILTVEVPVNSLHLIVVNWAFSAHGWETGGATTTNGWGVGLGDSVEFEQGVQPAFEHVRGDYRGTGLDTPQFVDLFNNFAWVAAPGPHDVRPYAFANNGTTQGHIQISDIRMMVTVL
jgi:hypothetical protein